MSGRLSSRLSSSGSRGGRSRSRSGITINGLLRGAGKGGNVILVLDDNGDGFTNVDILRTFGHQNFRHKALRMIDMRRGYFILGGEIKSALVGRNLIVRGAKKRQT